MKITHVEPIILRLPKVTEDVDGTQDDLLIKVETDEGIHGWGEVDSSPEVARVVVEAPTSHGIAHGPSRSRGPHTFDIWRGMYRAIIITVVSDLLTEPFRLVGGHVEVPEKPGLGIEVNPDVVAKYRVV